MPAMLFIALLVIVGLLFVSRGLFFRWRLRRALIGRPLT
jgi:hypothetical protein